MLISIRCNWLSSKGISLEKYKKNDTVARALFVNMYKDLSCHLPALSKNDVIGCISFQRMTLYSLDGRTLDGQFLSVQRPKYWRRQNITFLAVTLICDIVWHEGIWVQRTEIGSSDLEVYDPDVSNYDVRYSLFSTIFVLALTCYQNQNKSCR